MTELETEDEEVALEAEAEDVAEEAVLEVEVATVVVDQLSAAARLETAIMLQRYALALIRTTANITKDSNSDVYIKKIEFSDVILIRHPNKIN